MIEESEDKQIISFGKNRTIICISPLNDDEGILFEIKLQHSRSLPFIRKLNKTEITSRNSIYVGVLLYFLTFYGNRGKRQIWYKWQRLFPYKPINVGIDQKFNY